MRIGRGCPLCGGHVNGAGICTECGIDVKRNYARTYEVNKNNCEDAPLTHVHAANEPGKQGNAKSRQTPQRQPQQIQSSQANMNGKQINTGAKQVSTSTEGKKKGLGCLGCFGWILLLLFFRFIISFL